MVMVNGLAWKALIEEEFGDRIMSAVDFDLKLDRLANHTHCPVRRTDDLALFNSDLVGSDVHRHTKPSSALIQRSAAKLTCKHCNAVEVPAAQLNAP
jgi:hypothetical protein